MAAAPLDRIPRFVKSGTMLPLVDSEIDTLVKEDQADLNGFDDANQSMQVIFFGEGRDEFMLWDGARLHCANDSVHHECTIQDSPSPRSLSFEFR